MKKRVILIVCIVAALAVVLSGCVENKLPTQWDLLKAAYAKIGEATAVTQTVEITHNKITQYKREQTYTANGDEYDVVSKESKLNSLDADDPYTETETTFKAQTVETVNALKFEDEFFNDDFVISETSFKGSVPKNSIKEFLQIASDIKTPDSDVAIEITFDTEHVTGLTLGYESGESHVSIVLTFAY